MYHFTVFEFAKVISVILWLMHTLHRQQSDIMLASYPFSVFRDIVLISLKSKKDLSSSILEFS